MVVLVPPKPNVGAFEEVLPAPKPPNPNANKQYHVSVSFFQFTEVSPLNTIATNTWNKPQHLFHSPFS